MAFTALARLPSLVMQATESIKIPDSEENEENEDSQKGEKENKEPRNKETDIL